MSFIVVVVMVDLALILALSRYVGEEYRKGEQNEN